MVTRLRRINPVQFGLVYGLVNAFVFLILAVLWLPFGAAMMAAGGDAMGRMMGAGFGVFMIVIYPVFGFIFTFIFGAIGAVIYNLVAGWTGGIEITLQETPAGVAAGPAL